MEQALVLRGTPYLIISAMAMGLIFLGNVSFNRKRRIKAGGKWAFFTKLSKNEFMKNLQYSPGSKEYRDIEVKLKKAGLNDLSVGAYQMIKYIFPLVIYALIMAIKYTNITNTLSNIDKLEKIGRSISEVNTDLMILPMFGFSLLFYFVPDLILKLITRYRNAKGEKEVMMLQTYAVMMLRTNRSVKQILNSLYERAEIYKEQLEIAINSYSKNPTEALNELAIQAGHPYFEKICIALEQALNNDSEVSLIYLESNRGLAREINKIERKRKTTKKSMFGMVLLILPMIMLFAIGGYPWVVYALQQLDGTIL